jgi:hypothetical protein
MTPSLHALLAGVVDYAGLFPPAKLPLDEALPNYARYRREPDRWMLGRFICPADRLREVDSLAGELFPDDAPPFVFSALGRGGNTAGEFLAVLQADLFYAKAFRERHPGKVEVDVLEVRLPKGVLVAGEPTAARELFAQAARVFRDQPLEVTAYYEVPLGKEYRAAVPSVLSALRRCDEGGPAGMKLRCGGLEASAFPSSEQVAFSLAACRDAGVALKCTAGLHHPVRRFDSSVQTHMHGFVNVFVAGVLAHARRLEEGTLRRILEDEVPEHFVFDATGLRWGDQVATVEEIRAARRDSILSFGSCSFDEPRDDLRSLGWLGDPT